jgi:hypothetical protein
VARPWTTRRMKTTLIAILYVYVTIDPIKGCWAERCWHLWVQVHEKFCLLQQKEFAEIGVNTYIGTKDSIKQRWKKRISKSVQLWNKYYTTRQLKGTQKVVGMKINTSRRPVHRTSLILATHLDSQSV